MVVARAIAVWLLIILAESINGVVRTLWIAPSLGDFAARQLGVFTGSLIILIVAWLSVRWIGARSRRSLVAVWLLWVALTVGFEISVGRLLGRPWPEIAADYDVRRGGLLLFGLIVLTVTPWIAARARGVGIR